MTCLLQSSKAYKIGVMFCRCGQATEEEMYGNGELLVLGFGTYLLPVSPSINS